MLYIRRNINIPYSLLFTVCYICHFFYFSQTANFGTNVIMETMVYKMFNKKENWDMVNYYILITSCTYIYDSKYLICYLL